MLLAISLCLIVPAVIQMKTSFKNAQDTHRLIRVGCKSDSFMVTKRKDTVIPRIRVSLFLNIINYLFSCVPTVFASHEGQN
jgi:hypothetical protein